MLQSRSTTITETEKVSSVRTTPKRRNREVGEDDPFGRRSQLSPVATAPSQVLATAILALSVFALSGCMTTSKHACEHPAIPTGVSESAPPIFAPDTSAVDKPVGLVRLQSPADVAESYALPAQPG